MSRWKLTIEYDGGGFVGWQRQENGLSVQEVLETAVQRFCGEAVRLYGAGRTDAGVHALGQVAHVDIARETTARVVRDALNAHLRPHAVAVLAAEKAPDGFNARTAARSRQYLYRIVNRRAPLAIDRGRAWHVAKPLDHEAMHAAAQVLVGRHDFTSFRASLCQARSPVKTLDALEVARDGEEIRIHARARSFLHHQVRNMAGTLRLVGEGKWTADDVTAALAARDRAAAGPTAPPDGLYLVAVGYP
jgi:tRNA pseudouridine38-40 synthase